MKAAVWCQNKPSGSCFCGCSVAADTAWVCWGFFAFFEVAAPPAARFWSTCPLLLLVLLVALYFFSLDSFCQWLRKMASTYWTWQPRLTPLPTTSARPSGATWSFPRPSAGRRTLRWGIKGQTKSHCRNKTMTFLMTPYFKWECNKKTHEIFFMAPSPAHSLYNSKVC